MDDLRSLHDDHVFLRREALDHGYSDEDLTSGLRDRVLVRIRHGGYTFTDVWSTADDVGRHQLRSHAVLLSHSTPVVLSHMSAAVEHGLRLFQPDLSKVHLLVRDGRLARTTGDVVYHRGNYADEDITLVGGRPTVEPVLAGLQAASLTGVAGGMVILDSVVDLKKGTVEELHARYAKMAGHPFSRRLQLTVRLVRKGAQSVGETLSRHMMWTQHLPEPRLQFEVHDHEGRLIGITDFAWPDFGVLGEFDGLHKYGRLLEEGETPGDAVTKEKVREDKLREATDWLMVRIIWSEIFTPGVTGARIRRQLKRGRVLRVA